MPPSTQTANTRPMYSRPIDGCTGRMTIRNAPATPAVAIESAKANSLIRTGSTPIRRSAKLVLRHREHGAAEERPGQEQLHAATIATETRNGTTRRIGKSTAPSLQVVPSRRAGTMR